MYINDIPKNIFIKFRKYILFSEFMEIKFIVFNAQSKMVHLFCNWLVLKKMN